MKISYAILKLFNPLKNALQYSMGSILFFLSFSTFDIGKYILGMVGFVIAYQSVYQYNDLMDYEKDVKDKMKKNKPLVSGRYSREHVETLSYVLPLIGLPLCFLTSTYFGMLVVLTLMLNFFHSSKILNLKKTNLLLPNFFVLEFIKYSLGWFAFSSNLSDFPYFFLAFVTMSYTVGYVVWKQKLSYSVRSLKVRILTLASILFYLLSLFAYSYKLPLILCMVLIISALALLRHNRYRNMVFGSFLAVMIIVCTVVSLFLLSNPFFSSLNSSLSVFIDSIRDAIMTVFIA